MERKVVFRSPWPHINFDQELRVGGADGKSTWGATPRARDLAAAIAAVPDAWFVGFLLELFTLSNNRAMAVAMFAERAGLSIDQLKLDALRRQCPLDFDPEDSARLLQLRQAIDAIGWNSPEDEQRGDYLGRLHEIREELATASMAKRSPDAIVWPPPDYDGVGEPRLPDEYKDRYYHYHYHCKLFGGRCTLQQSKWDDMSKRWKLLLCLQDNIALELYAWAEDVGLGDKISTGRRS